MAVAIYQRSLEDLLWGYRPLFLFLGVWGVVVFALEHTFTRSPRGLRWLGLSSLSGIALALGFPGIIPVPVLMFAGFVPLLMVEREIAADERATRWAVLKYAYHTFIVWNIITTYWVANSALPAGIFAIMVNSLLMCIPFMLFHETRKRLPALGYASLVVYWITFEYGHLNWELTWPWLNLGNSFAEWPSWVQWYEYTGVFGGALWILALNVQILRWWLHYRETGQIQRNNLIGVGLILVLPLAASLYRYYTYQAEGATIEVVVVQPNFEPHYEKFSVPETDQVERFLSLTAEEIDEDTDYVVYPESSFGYLYTHRINQYPAIRRVREFLQPYPEATLITGLNAIDRLGREEPHSPATRQWVRAGDTVYVEVLNIAAQIDNGAEDVQIYRKSKLVPGPEIFPYRSLLWFLGPLVDKLQGTWEGIGIQAERSVLRNDEAAVAPVICYESVFGQYHAGYIRKGAEVIFIMTNDGWWDNTAGHRQHLYFASLRAIETRRSIARSANTGVSAFINQRGDILQATAYDEPAAIKREISLNDHLTFYVRWGDMLARLALFTSIIFLLNLVVRSATQR